MIREWSRSQRALRAVAAVCPVLALLCTGPAGVWPRPWLVGLALLLGLLYGGRPESGVGLGALGLVLVWWGLAFDDGLHAWALPSAALLVGAHLAGLLASYGPGGLRVEAGLVRLWVRRGLLVLTISPIVLLAALLLRDRPDTPGMWVAGLAAALVAMVVASLGLARED